MMELNNIKIKEPSMQVRDFKLALEHAKMKASDANPRKQLPLKVDLKEEVHGIVTGNETPDSKIQYDAVPTGNVYAGLTSATKRKRSEIITTNKTSPSQRSSDSSTVSSPHLTPTGESSKRPFAPAKKGKRAPTKYDEM